MIVALDNPITLAIKALYGFAQTVDKGLEDLMDRMKRHENPTVVRTGNILEAAKFGFGLGYVTSVIVIAVGQLILGNTLSAVGTVATAVALSNPIAMTCGAIGAIYYGWKALSDDERNAIVARLMEAFSVGSELIKAMISFVIATTKDLLSAENFVEVKRFITEAAGAFGNTLSDVTHAIKDTVVDTFDVVTTKGMRVASDAQDYIAEKLGRDKGQTDSVKQIVEGKRAD